MEKITANLIELHVGGFKTDKDKEAFEVFCECLFSMNDGIVLTPFYSDGGELMSFVVDSKKAAKIVEKGKDES